MHKIFQLLSALLLTVLTALNSCSSQKTWTKTEANLIGSSPELMKVLSADVPEELAILRSECTDIPARAISEGTFAVLARKMVHTVTDPSQDGVGIAGPQIGVTRRIVAVQRLDKDGEPFEVYPNIRITAMRGEMTAGTEGCLSVPDQRGVVMRSRDIDITYTSMNSLRDTSETVTGFTAVIFQHECDHLAGVLFTDKTIAQ